MPKIRVLVDEIYKTEKEVDVTDEELMLLLGTQNTVGVSDLVYNLRESIHERVIGEDDIKNTFHTTADYNPVEPLEFYLPKQ